MVSTTGRHVVLGYDPGGRSGVAIARFGGGQQASCDWDTVGSVDEGLDWYAENLAGEIPTGIGIDAPLCWQTGKCGWRGPDRWLRDTYRKLKHSVVSANGPVRPLLVPRSLCLRSPNGPRTSSKCATLKMRTASAH